VPRGAAPSDRSARHRRFGGAFEILLGGEDFDGNSPSGTWYVNRRRSRRGVSWVRSMPSRSEVSAFQILLALADIKRFVNAASLFPPTDAADRRDGRFAEAVARPTSPPHLKQAVRAGLSAAQQRRSS